MKYNRQFITTYEDKKMSKLDFLNQKNWYQSKTIWVQIITMLLGLGLIFTEQYVEGITFTVAGVLNTILRFLTKDEVTLR